MIDESAQPVAETALVDRRRRWLKERSPLSDPSHGLGSHALDPHRVAFRLAIASTIFCRYAACRSIPTRAAPVVNRATSR